MNLNYFVDIIIISVFAIMQCYYFTPWSNVKDKVEDYIHKKYNLENTILFKVLNCTVCFTFWSSMIYFFLFQNLNILLAFKLALINTLLTKILEEKFIVY